MSLALAWPISQVPQAISPDEIHVWAWPLESREDDLPAHVALLDEEELGRMSRFHFDRDRLRFVIAHANMRRILGAYLHRPPGSIRFLANSFGKPELASPTRSIHFNLSHSSTLAVIALALDAAVGVDVEDLRAIDSEVADAHFSARELAALRSLQGDEWLAGFYRCWTRKEAILKAEGVGLAIPLDAFDVSLLPDAPAELLETRAPGKLRHPWKLHTLAPAKETIGALAASSAGATIACFSFFPSLPEQG